MTDVVSGKPVVWDEVREQYAFAVGATGLEDATDDLYDVVRGATYAQGQDLPDKERRLAEQKRYRRLRREGRDHALTLREDDLATARTVALFGLATLPERANGVPSTGADGPETRPAAHGKESGATTGRQTSAHEREANFEPGVQHAVDVLWSEIARRPQSYRDPKFVIVAGQPGAGKSTSIRNFEAKFQGIVYVASDNFRCFAPEYQSQFRQSIADPGLYSRETGRFAHDVRIALLDRCLSEHRSVLLEHTLSDASSDSTHQQSAIFGIVEPFIEADYQFSLSFVATPEITSLVSTAERYSKLIQETGAIHALSPELIGVGGRWVGLEAHKRSYESSPRNARLLVERLGIRLERVEVTGRSGDAPSVDAAIEPGALAGQWLEASVKAARLRRDPRLKAHNEADPRRMAVDTYEHSLEQARAVCPNLDVAHLEFRVIHEYLADSTGGLPPLET